MNLHRTSTKPEWSDVRHPNVWQRLAAATGGTVTPGNVLTLAGAVLVAWGLWRLAGGDYLNALGLLVLGRAFDLLDGFAADKTGTKSPLGEALDAGIDKLATFVTLAVFGLAQIAPWWLIIAIVLPHTTIAAITLARYGKREIHPSRTGKLSMATAWAALAGFVIVRAFPVSGVDILVVAVYGLAGLSIVLGANAAAGYARGRT